MVVGSDDFFSIENGGRFSFLNKCEFLVVLVIRGVFDFLVFW